MTGTNLLLIGYGLSKQEEQKGAGADKIKPVQGRIIDDSAVSWDAEPENEPHLVDRDEANVEEVPNKTRSEPFLQNLPPVILLPGVTTLPSKVEGEADAPQGGEACHEKKALVPSRVCGPDPDVDRGHLKKEQRSC